MALDLLNQSQLSFPQAPQAQPSQKVNAGSLLTAPFKAVGSALGSFFSPRPNTIQAPSNPLAGLGNGYQPLSLGGMVATPPASAFNVGLPQPTPQQAPQPTITHTTKTVATPAPSVGLPQAPTQNLAVQNTGQNPSTVNPNFSGVTAPPPSPSSFGNNPISQDGYVPSSSIASNTTYADVLAKRKQYEQQYQNALLQAAQTQVGGLQNVQDARYAGDTQTFAAGMGERAQNDANLANLAATSKANAYGTLLGVNQTDLTNSLNAAPTTQGLQTSQNGDVFSQTRNPVTGETQLTSYGNIYNGTFNGKPSTGGGAIGAGQGTQQGGGSALPSANGQVANVSVPFQLQGAVFTAPNGQAYVAEDKLTPGLQTAQTVVAKNAGIPVLSTDQVAAVRNVDYVKQQIGGIQSIVGSILSSGTTGRLKDMVVNPIKNFLQTDTNISTFNAYRETAINTIQSLAGGSGSGLRLTTGEIAQASANIPEITDNLDTANAKLQKLNTFLDNKMATILPPINKTQSASSSGGSLWSF